MEKLLKLGAKLPVIKAWCARQLNLIHQRRLENELVDALVDALTEEIRKEIDAEIIQKILTTVNAQVGATAEGKYGKSNQI